MEELSKEQIFNLCDSALYDTECFITQCIEYDVKYPVDYANKIHSIIMQIISLL